MTATTLAFEGYRRADGRVGIRNHVLVLAPTALTAASAATITGRVRGTICITTGTRRGQVGDVVVVPGDRNGPETYGHQFNTSSARAAS